MSVKTTILVLLFTTLIPAGIQAATVARHSSSGAIARASFSKSENCTDMVGQANFVTTTGSVEFSESTTSDNGKVTPIPSGFVYFSIYNGCTSDFQIWSSSDFYTTNLTFSHTPATYGSFPKTGSGSGDFLLINLFPWTLGNRNIHVQLNLVSADLPHEVVSKSLREDRLPFGQIFKSTIDTNSHESSAIGSLIITGDFQYEIQSQGGSWGGSLGVDISRTFTVIH